MEPHNVSTVILDWYVSILAYLKQSQWKNTTTDETKNLSKFKQKTHFARIGKLKNVPQTLIVTVDDPSVTSVQHTIDFFPGPYDTIQIACDQLENVTEIVSKLVRFYGTPEDKRRLNDILAARNAL